MNTKIAIKDNRGIVLGWIEEDSIGNKVVYAYGGKILGRYDKHADVTRDYYGKIVARGDQSSMLIGMNIK